MKQFLLRLIFPVLCAVCLTAHAQTTQETVTMLKGQLSTAKTPGDSIRIMLNIFDALPKNERPQTGREIYETATRAQDTHSRITILRHLSACFDDAEILQKIEDELKRLPPSIPQREGALYVKMRKISARARKLSEEDRQKEIVKAIHAFENKGENDNLHQILDLYTLVEFLRNNASGDMLKDYIERLNELVNTTNIHLPAIKYLVYSESASIYSDAGNPEKAVEANRKALETLEKLEKEYHDQGRIYRHYDITLYTLYRRMLRNAKALQPGEAHKYYEMAMKLAEKKPDIQQDIETNPRLRAYYYMAIGDYNSAVPELKKAITQNNSMPVYKQLLEMLILASKETGDAKTQLEAMEKYITILYELIDLKAGEKSRELEIKYDLEDLKNRNKSLEIENAQQEIKSERSIMTLVSVAFLLIFVAFVIMLLNWGRYKKNTIRMGHVVDNMHNERNSLRNTLYIDNYDIDPLAEEENRKKLSWNQRMKERNMKRGDATIFMTESIINDLLYIAWVGHHNVVKNITSTTVDTIMRRAESRAGEIVPSLEKLRIQYPENDIRLLTDADCLSALMAHIFNVIVNYDKTTLARIYCEKYDDENVNFIITLEGVPSANVNGPQIFKDMPVSDILLNHKNSGLYVCRMISMLLRCELIPDKTYEECARYIFRVPLKMEN